MPESTLFSPAERSSDEELRVEVAQFARRFSMRGLLDRIPSMILVLNRRRETVFANVSALKVAGARALDDVVGLRPGELLGCTHVKMEHQSCGATPFCRYCDANKAVTGAEAGVTTPEDCHIQRIRDGKAEALDLRVWASSFEIDGDAYTFTVLADISDESRRIFLEKIFLHDLSNTATAVFGYAELLRDPNVNSDILTDRKSLMHLATEQLVQQIEEHRHLVLAESGELIAQPQLIWSHELLRDVQRLYICRNRETCVELNSEAVEKFELFSDPILLRRVLGNMLKNAIEASKPKEIVRIGCRAEDDVVRFWVQNPGTMSEEVQYRIFNRSFSTKGAGRGLGTYSIKFLTERYLGGKVSFTSGGDEGTTFYVILPKRIPG